MNRKRHELPDFKNDLNNCGGFFDLDTKIDEIAEREQLSESPNFWDDNVVAQKIMQEISERKEWIELWKSAQQTVDDADAMIQLADELADESLENDINTELLKSQQTVDELELRKILSGKDDSRNAILTIHAGAGGTEEKEWPGNVRELVSTIRLALQTTQSDQIEVIDLHRAISPSSSPDNSVGQFNFSTERSLRDDIARADQMKIEATLERCKGNVSKAAAILSISRETLHNKIRRYGINTHDFRAK